jgi:hypothetical protein
LCDVYIVDGVFVNAATCVVDCRNYGKLYGCCCDQLGCWRRAHTWLLLTFHDQDRQCVRGLHVDITSAALGRYDGNTVGQIPVHAAFKPYYWPGSEHGRDPVAFVERREPLATYDRLHAEQALAACETLNDAQVDAMRGAEQRCGFYAIGSVRRLRHFEQCCLENNSLLHMSPTDRPSLTTGGASEIEQLMRREAAHINVGTDKSLIGVKTRQLVVNAIAVNCISSMFLNVFAD